jgi:DNA-binding NarL/FixJ family response regulator
MHDSELLVQEVLGAGAHGYILKDDADRNLVAAVDALQRHKPYLSSRVSEAASGAAGRDGSAFGQPSRSRLTPREREILQLLAEGKSNKEVAGFLGISVKTAETHRANIMLKLDFHSITELVRYAVRNKIIQS